MACRHAADRTRERRPAECATCGKTFESSLDHGAWKKYCSRTCFCNQNDNATKTLSCLGCGAIFSARGRRSKFPKFCTSCALKQRTTKARTNQCANCGTLFKIQPTQPKTTKFCSKKCLSDGMRQTRTGKTHTQASIEKLRDSLKTKWASGTRKKNPEEMYRRTSEIQRRYYADGTRKPHLTYEDSMRGLAARDMKKVADACRRTGKLKLGIPNPPGPSEAGPENMWAKYWVVRSPAGIVLRGKNLNHIVRENSSMFAATDIVWINSQCRASKRLAQLFQTKSDGRTPAARSWKGWTPVLKSEEVEPSPHHGKKIVTLPTY